MFKVLSVLLALYIAQCILTGKVFVKSGLWGKTVERDESPTQFWLCTAVYIALALALLFVF
jgi:hypothetical protein